MDQQTTNKQTNGKSKRGRVEPPPPPLPLFLPSPFPFSPFPFPFFSHSRTRLLVFLSPRYFSSFPLSLSSPHFFELPSLLVLFSPLTVHCLAISPSSELILSKSFLRAKHYSQQLHHQQQRHQLATIIKTTPETTDRNIHIHLHIHIHTHTPT